MVESVEVIGCIQHVIAPVVECRAVKTVRATLSQNADDRTHGLPVFRTIAVPQNLEFLDGVDRWVNQDGAIRADVVVIHSVDQEDVAGGVVAIHRKVDAGLQALILGIKVGSRGNARHQLGQLREAAAIQRQLLDLVPFHNVTHGATRGFYLNRAGFHGYLLIYLSDLQLRIDNGDAGNVQHNILADRLLEVRLLH